MQQQEIERGEPSRLSRLFVTAQQPSWGAGELADILRHQLGVALIAELEGYQAQHSIAELSNSNEGKLRTYGDLFVHPNPPLELLRLTKEFVKNSDKQTAGGIPPEVATVLYYGAIAIALLRHGQRITELTSDAIRKGIEWVLRQRWLDTATRRPFEEALARLSH